MSNLAKDAAKPSPQPSEKPKSPNKRLRNSAIVVIVLFALFAYLGSGSNKQDVACDQQIDAGTKLVQSGDLAGAAEQSRLAATSCTGNRVSKATELQTLVTAAQTAIVARAQCARAYGVVSSRLKDGRLNAASNALNQLPSACLDSSEATQLKDQIGQQSTAADATEQNVRAAIAAGDALGALAALQDLARLDRFRTTLPGLRSQIAEIHAPKSAEQGVATNGPTTAFSNSSPPALVTQPPIVARAVPQAVQPAAPTENNQAALAEQFLNDAQTALGQNRFDAAKTYLDSARRMNPNNPRIDGLTRAVQNREHEVLQNETSIK